MIGLRVLVPSFAALLLAFSIFPVGLGAALAQEGPRLQAVISSNGGVVRSVGVDNVNNVAAGVYCIRPQESAGLDLADIYPSLTLVKTPDVTPNGYLTYSVANERCGRRTIEVRTSIFRVLGGNPVIIPANRPFVIVVH